MDGANVNGGNADEARENPNLEADSMPDLQEAQDKVETATKMDGQEVNGDIKGSSKKGTALLNVRRKLRKFKAMSTSTIESDTTLNTKGRKRKVSEPDDLSSEESMGFNGFDVQGGNETEPGSHVLKKLIGIGDYCYARFNGCKLRVLVFRNSFAVFRQRYSRYFVGFVTVLINRSPRYFM